MKKKGLFIVIEGIDGSGTTTQTSRLHNRIKKFSKYLDVLTTREPWRNDEIRRVLQEDKDAYSSGERMTELFITDRRNHLYKSIIPNLDLGAIVISDRYSLSTYAYQRVQGVARETIKKCMKKQK